MTKLKSSLKIGLALDGGLEEPDGVQQYILALGEYYKSQGHTIRYIVAGPIVYGQEDAISLQRSITVRANGNNLTMPMLPASRKSLRQFMKDEQLDVLHVQAPYSPLMAEQLVFLADPKTAIIGTFHIVPRNLAISIGDRLLGLWCRFSIKHFDTIVSVSKAAQRIAKRDYGISTDIVPNIIDFNRFSKAKPLMKEDATLNILFLGRLVERKGCAQLLKAISILSKRHDLPKFKVIICGKGPLESKLKNYVKNNGLDDLVEFKGFVSEELKPSYYASADISVFPSLGGESFGIVLLEAMASGRSVVLAGDNEGYKSVMEKQPHLIFPRRDEAALADKIALFLKDKDLRSHYNQWGKSYAASFDVKIVGSKLLDIYKQALRKRYAEEIM